MENLKIDGEQLDIIEREAEQGKTEDDNSTKGIIDSSLGKFENADELKKAYEALEKEFTKKCQKIKELEGKTSEVDNTAKEKVPTEKNTNEKKIDWKEQVNHLMKENDFFKENITLIADEIKEKPELAEKSDGLLVALNNVMSKNYKAKKDLASDNEFLENYIFSNEKIRGKMIEDYLLNVASKKTVKVINGKNSLLPLTPKSRLSSFSEAGNVAKEMLEN